MKHRKININKLQEAYYNPRVALRAGDEEYEKLRRSIQEFGYVLPVIVNEKDNTIIGGHQRVNVMKELGYTEIDVIFIDVDETDERVLNIALNKIEGEWDLDKLKDLMQEFDENDIDSTVTGFSEDDIVSFLGDDDEEEKAESVTYEDESKEETEIKCPVCDHVAIKDEFVN